MFQYMFSYAIPILFLIVGLLILELRGVFLLTLPGPAISLRSLLALNGRLVLLLFLELLKINALLGGKRHTQFAFCNHGVGFLCCQEIC